MDSNEFGRVRAPLVRVYVALTDRSPTDLDDAFADQAGRFATGTSLDDLADEIIGTPGLLDRDGGSVAEVGATFVQDTFRFVQGRNPTLAEQQAGEDALDGGGGRGAWVAAGQAASAKERLEPEVYVTMSYVGMLGRVPDLGGYDFWVGGAGRQLHPPADLQLPAEQRVRHPRHLSRALRSSGASPGPGGTGPGLLRLCAGSRQNRVRRRCG